MIVGELKDLDLRCWNWGRWAGGGDSRGGGSCASAERLYVPPRDDDNTRRLEILAREPIDALDAEVIEGGVIGIPYRRSRKFIIQVYVWRATREFLADRFRLREEMVQSFHEQVLLGLHSSLQRRQFALSPLAKRLLSRV